MKSQTVSHHVGWAVDAYPEQSRAAMERSLARMKRAGATWAWIGHNNPGEVYRNHWEVALSYAVFEALTDRRDPRHEDARAIASAQRRILEACRRMGLPVVFPIGYQIQMGERWNAAHPTELRRTREGEIINWGGVSASWCSSVYQEDIRRFFKWAHEEFIAPFKDLILMVNLADEPFGGDYSAPAEKTFLQQTGLTFTQAARGGPQEQEAIGEFQANYIVRYADWSAHAYREVDSAHPTTMSFCGHHGREENTMPCVPSLFAKTPRYFHITFDVYPRDGPYEIPPTENDVTPLIVFLRQLGHLSRKYRKPYHLWTTGNSWGLGQNSTDKANIADALANAHYCVSAAAGSGGDLRGIAVWNYNIKTQGLYNDINPIVYHPDEMFERLTHFLAMLRPMMKMRKRPGVARWVVVAPKQTGYRVVGESGQVVWVRPFGFERLTELAKSGESFVVEENLKDALEILDTAAGRKKGAPSQRLLFLEEPAEVLNRSEAALLVKHLKRGLRILAPQRYLENLERTAKGKKSLKGLNEKLQTQLCSYSNDEELCGHKFFDDISSSRNSNLYAFELDQARLFYNLTGRSQDFIVDESFAGCSIAAMSIHGRVRSVEDVNASGRARKISLDHHEAALVFPKGHRRWNLWVGEARKIKPRATDDPKIFERVNLAK
ncbi:MAG: hypothetical protein V2A74_13560 [bacterium]